MSVRIGHASIAETGGVYGQPGDQTGREVCVRNWYANGWQFMAIHPDAAVRERHARAVEAACANDCVGYSWDSRNTLYQQARAVGMDISKITVRCNCDCSSLQNCAAVASGAPGVSYGENGWVTTNMLQYLRAAGYAILTDPAMLRSAAYAVRGAIYVSEGHTVCALDDGDRAEETLRAAGIPEEVIIEPEDPPEADGDDGTSGPATPVDETPGVVVVPEEGERPSGAGAFVLTLHTLRRGDISEEVRAAQSLLIGRDCSCGPDGADGEFGPNTYDAVCRFQRSRGLAADGVIGPKTMAALHGLR